MLAGLLIFIAVWATIDAIIIAVGWCFVTVIKPRYPEWWRRVIVNKDTTDYPLTFK